MAVRFLHTSDWQLGLAPHFLGAEARARYAEARFAAVVRLGEVARGEGCEAIVVAGDVFESNQVDRRTVLRGLDAMAAAGLPVFLLPGNHDPLDAGSVYLSRTFREHRPEAVRVLATTEPVVLRTGVEVAGAPWTSRRPGADLVAALAAGLAPYSGGVRIAVGHGAVDALAPDRRAPSTIALDGARQAIAEGRFHYLALGDRHSTTRLDERIHYSGTPEASDFDEERPGEALVVELAAEASGTRCEVRPVAVGSWRFVRAERRLAGEEDVAALADWLAAIPEIERSRTALRLGLVGELSLHARARLDEVLELAAERFAACEPWAARTDLVAIPDRIDEGELALSGFAAEALRQLLAEARDAADPGARQAASDALVLLHRLTRRDRPRTPPAASREFPA